MEELCENLACYHSRLLWALDLEGQLIKEIPDYRVTPIFFLRCGKIRDQRKVNRSVPLLDWRVTNFDGWFVAYACDDLDKFVYFSPPTS